MTVVPAVQIVLGRAEFRVLVAGKSVEVAGVVKVEQIGHRVHEDAGLCRCHPPTPSGRRECRGAFAKPAACRC
jgi:hypothetical protein